MRRQQEREQRRREQEEKRRIEEMERRRKEEEERRRAEEEKRRADREQVLHIICKIDLMFCCWKQECIHLLVCLSGIYPPAAGGGTATPGDPAAAASA